MSDRIFGRRSRAVGADEGEDVAPAETPAGEHIAEHLNIVWPRVVDDSVANSSDAPGSAADVYVESDSLPSAPDWRVPVSPDPTAYVSTDVSNERSAVQAAARPAWLSADTILLRRWWVVLLGAVLISAATFAVSKVVPATYSSSSEVVVLVSGTDVNATTLGANNLASQYSQVVNSSQVLSMADKLMKPPGDVPTGSVSGGTVGAQNLVSIQATAASPQLAQARAVAVTDAFVKYINQQVANQATHYSQSSSAQLGPIGAEIAQTQAALDSAPPKSTKAQQLQSTLVTLLAQRASAQANIAQTAVAGRPSVQVTSNAGVGSQTAPRPTLYALVGFLVGLLIVARLVVYASRRRTATWSST